MHLITPLAAGVRGAENGSVDVFRRGTSTRATYYGDFEATLAVIPADSIDLDANGRALLYVNELVDVDCYASDGTLLLTFTAGAAAPAVEYQGQSFTGQKYDTAASGAGSGYGTTVQAALDRWKDSAGAVDFKVDVGGVATSLEDALAAAQPLYFDVTSPAYGAVGDAVTDDTVAINAAITAATAAGGGVVFFPAGLYRTTSALTLPDSVSILGAGSSCSGIGVDHATANAISVNSSTRQFIEGIAIGALQSNTGANISVASCRGLMIRDCSIGSTATNGDCIGIAVGANSFVVVDNCLMAMGTTGSSAITVVGAALRVHVHNSRFVMPATFNGIVVWGDHIDVTDCVFDGSASTAGTYSYYAAKTTTLDATLRGCKFLASGGATVTAMTLGTYVAASVFSEVGSTFGASVTAYSYICNVTTAGAQVQLKTRESRVLYDTNSAATYTALVQQYGVIFVNSSRAGNVALAHTGLPPAGSRFTIVVANTDGSARDFTPGTSLWGAAQTIASGGIWAFQTTCVLLPAGTLYMVGGWGGKT